MQREYGLHHYGYPEGVLVGPQNRAPTKLMKEPASLWLPITLQVGTAVKPSQTLTCYWAEANQKMLAPDNH